MLCSQTHAEDFAVRRALATGDVHLVVCSHIPGQHYRVLTPADVLAEADHYCLDDVLFTADPDQLNIDFDSRENNAA
jgi:hypothetical protein